MFGVSGYCGFFRGAVFAGAASRGRGCSDLAQCSTNIVTLDKANGRTEIS